MTRIENTMTCLRMISNLCKNTHQTSIAHPRPIIENGMNVKILKNDWENLAANVVYELFNAIPNKKYVPTVAALPTNNIARCRIFIF
ncbi:protein of unknown function [Nitrosotalea devaniterrae]|uniref:Uncharacterized protein n=1 Tax=Nitrosotalea devaniterrae TaxID=1078905 RepID=A0A128A1Y0_9ARCH|nr:protein of unknown function [Candidatus Nitrosotalea devanaterra]